MFDELIKLSATKLVALIAARKVSPVEVLEAHLRKIEQLNPKLNAIVTLAHDSLERAREAESAIMRGDELGSLHGVPFTVKDTIETESVLTTSGSRLRASHIPKTDAPAVARLKRAGAILLGKTNVSEMAIPYECDNPVFGRTNNPHDLKKTSGGSSGGEAAAISACLSPVGLGSDLSGSIRVPAHFCGIAGLKPTTGRISSKGHYPPVTGAYSLGAVIGPMARRVEDLSLLLHVLSETKVRKMYEDKTIGLRGCRVAVYLDEKQAPVTGETEQAIQTALRTLSEAGLLVVEENPPGIERAIDLWPALFSNASLIELRNLYAGEEEKAGAVVSRLLASSESKGSLSLEADSARFEQEALSEEIAQWMNRTPLIIVPVGSVPAFEHGARRVNVKGESISVFRAFGYSRAANVLGFPSVTVPAGRTSSGLPVGIQIIGRPFDEETLLLAATIIEESLGGWINPPDQTA
ncbi:MAG TPA: amidase [Pyrinomonadaceae bacterium]|nr:amidase [Pyrinomonadaceae bacterium]